MACYDTPWQEEGLWVKTSFLAHTCDGGRFWEALRAIGAVTPIYSFKSNHLHNTAGNSPQHPTPGFRVHHRPLLSREAAQLLAVTLPPCSVSLCHWVSNRNSLGGDSGSFQLLRTSEIPKESNQKLLEIKRNFSTYFTGFWIRPMCVWFFFFWHCLIQRGIGFLIVQHQIAGSASWFFNSEQLCFY